MQTRQSILTEPSVSDDLCSASHHFIDQYNAIIGDQRLAWSSNLLLKKVLGSGGQGTVFYAERNGADRFCLPVAVKVFSPGPYSDPNEYDRDMSRLGLIASKVARIQHENLIDVHNFLVRDRVRIMIMEWIEGFDLRQLVTPRMYGVFKERVSAKRWEEFQDQVFTIGREQPRLRSYVALSIFQDCLEALYAIHEEGVVHADIKPANIMLNRNGRAKIIDIGSARDEATVSISNACTPVYAAPEVLAGEPPSPTTDLISLGYVILELLSGKPVFSNYDDLDKLLEEKMTLRSRMHNFIPDDVTNPELFDEIFLNLFGSEQDASQACEKCIDVLKKNVVPFDPVHSLKIWVEETLDAFDVSPDPE